jgi:hypothetical protein
MSASLVINRNNTLGDPAYAFEHPMEKFDPYSMMIPIPHLESFLEEVYHLDEELLNHDFVAMLCSVSKEDIEPNDEQISYARMCAYGFCNDPDMFSEHIDFVVNTNGAQCLKTTMTMKDTQNGLSTSTALLHLAFGLDIEISKAFTNFKKAPRGLLVRLSQVGVVDRDAFVRSEKDMLFLDRNHQNLSSLERIYRHALTPALEEALIEFPNNNLLSLMRLTSDTSLLVEALENEVSFGSILTALANTDAEVDTIIRSKVFDVDNDLISFFTDVM